MKTLKQTQDQLDLSKQVLDQAEHDRITRGIKTPRKQVEQQKGYIKALEWVLA